MYCIECHGRGMDKNDQICTRCHGTGFEMDSSEVDEMIILAETFDAIGQ